MTTITSAVQAANAITSATKAVSARAADGDYKTKGVGHEIKDADGDYKPTAKASAAVTAAASATLAAISGLKRGG